MYSKQVVLRIGAVEGEHRAAALAVRDLLVRSADDPTVLGSGEVTHADLRACRMNLEQTYLVRMFAVFEEALRDVRRIVYGRSGAIHAYSLLQQCASRQHARVDDLDNAHLVREYRNTIVHGGEAAPVPLPQARQWPCKFFGWMPPEW